MDNTQISDKNKHNLSMLLEKKGLLLIISENYFGKTFVINRHKTIIGRGEDVQAFIDDPLVSKQHCQIIFDEEGKFTLEDLESKNSTYLNGKAIKKSNKISYGDRIVIGETILRFFLEEKLGGKK